LGSFSNLGQPASSYSVYHVCGAMPSPLVASLIKFLIVSGICSSISSSMITSTVMPRHSCTPGWLIPASCASRTSIALNHAYWLQLDRGVSHTVHSEVLEMHSLSLIDRSQVPCCNKFEVFPQVLKNAKLYSIQYDL
jgi:hypothetical protein